MRYSAPVDWTAVAERLRETMRALKHGEKKDLAEKLDVSAAQLSQFISGKRGITPERAQQIVTALGGELSIRIKWPDGHVDE